MSHWDADRQEWVRGLNPGPTPEAAQAYEPPSAQPIPPPWAPEGEPGDQAPSGWPHRVILAVAVAAVLLVGGLGFGGWMLLRDDGGDSGATRPDTEVTTFEEPTSEAPTDTATETPTGTPTEDEPTTPPGYVRTEDPAGFALDVPQDWQRSVEADGVFYTAPDEQSLIQVWSLAGPEQTPYEALVATERTVSRNPDYENIRLERLGQGEADAAELEYRYTREDGTVRHVEIQSFTDAHGTQYALLVAGPDDDWSAHEAIYRILLSSFCTTVDCLSNAA